MPRSRFQLVAVLIFEVLPVVSPLMRLRSPCGNDVSLVLIPVSIDDRDLDAVHEPDRVDANFAVLEPIIDLLDGGSVENPHCIREADRMPEDVGEFLIGIPGEPHSQIFTLCIYDCQRYRGIWIV